MKGKTETIITIILACLALISGTIAISYHIGYSDGYEQSLQELRIIKK